MLMCSQIFPFVRAQTQGGVCLLDKKHRERKKNSKTHKQKFFEIFHEITQNVQLTVVTKRAFSLSLCASSSRERRRKSFTTPQIFDDDEWWWWSCYCEKTTLKKTTAKVLFYAREARGTAEEGGKENAKSFESHS